MMQLDTLAHATRLLQENEVLFEKIMAAIGCTRGEVPVALSEALRFMQLAADQGSGRLTPAHRVDLVWHEFILCTHAYATFCESHFGRMIHHYPGGSVDDNRRQFLETLRLYEQCFGPPDESYWGSRQPRAECGACESF